LTKEFRVGILRGELGLLLASPRGREDAYKRYEKKLWEEKRLEGSDKNLINSCCCCCCSW